MKLQSSGPNAEKGNGMCYSKLHGDIVYKLALYDDKRIFFGKKGETHEDNVIDSFDMSCGGTYRNQGKSVHISLDGLRGEASKLNLVTGEMTDRSVEEEADHVVITDEELINFWLFGKWTANGKSSSREEGYDSSESD